LTADIWHTTCQHCRHQKGAFLAQAYPGFPGKGLLSGCSNC